jgi:hypothetical protein
MCRVNIAHIICITGEGEYEGFSLAQAEALFNTQWKLTSVLQAIFNTAYKSASGY